MKFFIDLSFNSTFRFPPLAHIYKLSKRNSASIKYGAVEIYILYSKLNFYILTKALITAPAGDSFVLHP
jgi:hypothetical protein